jgi:hypothetical protein
VHLTVYPGRSRLHLPVRPHHDEGEIGFGPAQGTPAPHTTQLEPGEATWRVLRDLASDTSTLEIIKDEGVRRLEPIGTEVTQRAFERYTVVADDVSSARGETEWVRGLRRDEWDVRTVTRTWLTCDPTSFRLRATLDAYEQGHRVHAENWDRQVPRDHL